MNIPSQEKDPQKKLNVIQAHRDHAVVKDFTSEKGYTVISLKELHEKYPHRKEEFVATKVECQKWVDAPDAVTRKTIENWAEKRHQERVPLPSEMKRAATKDEVANVLEKFNLSVQTNLFGDASQGKGKGLGFK